MFEGVLEILPQRGLDQSILVSVLIGVFVILVLTETLGWVWAGLVVPGYLAAVFVIQPSSGIAICIEATLTFLVCRGISDVLSRLGGWSPFFGRERFFLIVLVSVVVRQNCELWLLRDFMIAVEDYTGLPVAYRELSSIGLVLVPLLANMAWKLSLPRAVWQVGITVGITWVIVALVVLPNTNLSYSSLELTYENVALDFLGSPKAYIILLATAFVAARFNLSYGWDYNGILVPSLLALTWFEPRVAVTTVIEALVLMYASGAVLSLPMLRRRNFEGPRKLALVFAVGFLMKLALGWALVIWWPDLRLTDLFGFGYVLTSLLAVKMLTLKRTGRVILPSVAVSLCGFVIGSAIGLGLEQLAPRTTPTQDPAREHTVETTRLVRSALGIAALASARTLVEPPRHERALVSRRELDAYAAAWRSLDTWMTTAAPPDPGLLARLDGLGLRIVKLRDDTRGCWGVIERQEVLARLRGWDSAIVCPGARGPVVEVIRPRQERAAAYAAARACERLDCTVVLFSGIDAETADDHQVSTTLRTANAALAHRAIIELRAASDAQPGAPVLHLSSTLPNSVHLPVLWREPLVLSWAPPPDDNALWKSATARVVLRVHPADLWSSLADTAPKIGVLPERSVFGWVDEWHAASNTPTPPSLTELLVLENQVVTPLATASEPVEVIADVAATLGHELRALPDGAGPRRAAWVVSGREDRGWIALALAAAPTVPIVFEAPRPRGEFGTGRIAAATWQAVGAAGLVLDPEWVDRSPVQGYANPTEPGQLATAFQATHQALTRITRRHPDGAVVQIRGFAGWRRIPDNIVIAMGHPVLDPKSIPVPLQRLMVPDGMLATLANGAVRWDDGSESIAAISGAGTPQQLYAQAVEVPFAMVWVSPGVRLRALPRSTREELQDRAHRIGLELVTLPIARALADGLHAAAEPSEALRRRHAAASALALEYAHTGDLSTLVELAQASGNTVALGWSPDLRVGYVLVEVREKATVIRVAALLGATPGPPCVRIEPGPNLDAEVWRAIGAWCPRLEISGLAQPP